MAELRPPHVPDKPVPVFAADDLARLERACAGRSFQQRRGAAVIAVLRTTGMRLSELAGIRYNPDDPRRSDLDLWHREITVHGKGGKTRDRQDQLRCRPRPRQVPPRSRQAWPDVPAAAVARHQQPRPDDR
jgi:site-specific recombinase XerC